MSVDIGHSELEGGTLTEWLSHWHTGATTNTSLELKSFQRRALHKTMIGKILLAEFLVRLF